MQAYEKRYTTRMTSSYGHDSVEPCGVSSLYGIYSVKGDYVNPTSHRYNRLRVRDCVGHIDSVNADTGSFLEWYDGSVLYAIQNPPSSTKDLTHIAYGNALSSFNDKVRGGLDLSVDLLQHRQVSSMIGGDIRLLSQAHNLVFRTELLVDFARKFKKKFRKLGPKAFGKKWLEYQYGWGPLVNSIYQALENLVDPKATRWSSTVRGYGRAADEFDYPFGNGRIQGTAQIRHVASCSIACVLNANSSFTQRLATYTSLNPASIAWELLPYSFVVDWVYNIGDFLRDLETKVVFQDTFVRGFVTQINACERRYGNFVQGTTYAGARHYYSCNTGVWDTLSYQRDVLTSYPGPRYPQLEPKLGAERLLSAASLLSLHLKR